ncbi:hypothetical protein LINPERPRIM_LOCUS35769 [Linum perenne]
MLQIYQALLVHQGPIHRFELAIPGCPLLEELMVLDCNIFIDPLFESASLKALFFHSSFTTICIKNTPCLSVLSVDDYNAGEYDPDIVALFAALPALKQLKLGLELLVISYIPFVNFCPVFSLLYVILLILT